MTNFSQKNRGAKQVSRGKKTSYAWWFVLLIIVIAIAAISAYCYRREKPLKVFSQVSSFVSTWIVEHRHSIKTKQLNNQAANKTKTLANNTDTQLHFEFYDTLPNAQMSAPLPLPDDAHTVSVASAYQNPQTQSARIKTPALSLVNADELANELSQHIKKLDYVVRVAGVFHSVEAASRVQANLARNGISARIAASTWAKKDIFRVELGPFPDKNAAKLTQRKLLKYKVESIVVSSTYQEINNQKRV